MEPNSMKAQPQRTLRIAGIALGLLLIIVTASAFSRTDSSFVSQAYGTFRSWTLRLGDRRLVQCLDGEVQATPENPTSKKSMYISCVAKLMTPAPTGMSMQPTSNPIASSTPAPLTHETAFGKCGEPNDRWHPPVITQKYADSVRLVAPNIQVGCATGHTHGDEPPSWIANAPDVTGLRYTGHLGNLNTAGIENLSGMTGMMLNGKHTSMKGYLATFPTRDGQKETVYFRHHFSSVPSERFGQYHSIEWWIKDATGAVSHGQSWTDVGDPLSGSRCEMVPGMTEDRCKSLTDATNEPLLLVVNDETRKTGRTCEVWYNEGFGFFSAALIDCDVQVDYSRSLESTSTDAFNTANWAGRIHGKGLANEQLDTAHAYLGDNGTPNTHTEYPRGTLFWTNQFGKLIGTGTTMPDKLECRGQVITGPNGKDYPSVCLSQYIQSTLKSITFPGNSTAGRDYGHSYIDANGTTVNVDTSGVQVPN